MIQVDYRIGSGEFEPLLQSLGMTVQVSTLLGGDFTFLGQGEGGCPIPVGIERKTVKDLLTSSQKGRMTEQLELMLLLYQDIWVVVEGVYRRGKDGLAEVKYGYAWVPLEIGKQRFMYREIESLILTLEERGGARVRKTQSPQETAEFLKDLYHWWTNKSLEEHRSHLRMRSLEADSALLIKPSVCWEWARCLPGIGYQKAGKVAGHFGNIPSKMSMAPADEWEKIQGVGKVMAGRIEKVLRGEVG